MWIPALPDPMNHALERFFALEVPHHRSGEYIGSIKFLAGTQGWDSNTSSTPIYFVFLLFLGLGQVQPGFSCLCLACFGIQPIEGPD